MGDKLVGVSGGEGRGSVVGGEKVVEESLGGV